MPRRILSFVPGVFAGLLAAVAITILPSGRAIAANECLAQPDRAPLEGGYWQYRADPGNNRKCWFLMKPESRTPQAEAPAAPAPPDATSPPTFSSFLSSLVAPFTPAKPAGAQQDPANGDPRITQTTHPGALTNNNDDKRPRMARRPDSSATLDRKQQRQSSTRPGHKDGQRPAQARKQAEQEALFEEFLRWRERRTP